MKRDEMPSYLPKEEFKGKATVCGNRLPKGSRIVKVRARWLSQFVKENEEGAFYSSFGYLRNSAEGFSHNRYMADDDGNLHVYTSDGPKLIVHPADRVLRIILRDA